jgi:hypothetical protein
MAEGDDKERDINGIPIDYKVWLIPHTEEDEDGFEEHWGNVIVKNDKVVVCDECPCEMNCYFLFSSECEVEIVDDEEGQSRTITWTEPVFEYADCGVAPEIVEEWFFVDYATCNYWAKGQKCRAENAYICEEDIPPEVSPPTFEECCDYAPIDTGCAELPYEWKTRTETVRIYNADKKVYEWKTRTRSYKEYTDYTLEENPLWIGGWAAGQCDWVEWKLEIADLQGKLYVRYLFPDDTYTDELLADSDFILPNDDGTCPVSTYIYLCPTWEAQLLLVSDYAADYNRLWYDTYSDVRPNAYVCVNGVRLSEPCSYYCHLKYTAECGTHKNNPDCPCIGDTEIEGPLDSVYQNPWRTPFPYNGPESQWYNAYDIWGARNSGWLTPDEENPEGYWRAVSKEKCDKSGTWVQLMCVDTHFQEWAASGGNTEIDCDSYEVPSQCPSQDCDPEADEKDEQCPPDPPLGCMDGWESKVIAEGKTNGALEAYLCVDLSAGKGEGIACPGQPWRLIEVGGNQPGYMADFDGCKCYDPDTGEEDSCPEQADTSNVYCLTYLSGVANEKGELMQSDGTPMPDDYCVEECSPTYWGYFELQLAGYDCESQQYDWPSCKGR